MSLVNSVRYASVLALIFLIAWVHNFLPKALFPFYFSPIILTYQPFLVDELKEIYFICVGVLLTIGMVLSLAFPKYKSKIALAISAIVLVFIFSPVLALYLLTVPILLYYLVNSILPKIYSRCLTNNPEFEVPLKLTCYFSVWALFCIIIPWSYVISNPRADFLRIIFLSIFSIRIALYMYDIELKKFKMSLINTLLYFLFPSHFFIIPSWIVCPFPSEFRTHDSKKELYSLSQDGTKKIFIGTLYLLLVLIVGYLVNTIFGYYPTQILSQMTVSSSWVQRTGFILMLSFLKIAYFFFIADIITGLYAFFGIKLTVPIFNNPFYSRNIFDFWNRFLIQTKNFILKLFVYPLFNIFKKYSPYTQLNFFMSLIIAFLFIDIPVHMFVVFDKNTAFDKNEFLFKWYLALMSLFAFYFLWRQFVPKKIQLFGEHPVGRLAKSTFWIALICYFY